MSANASFIWWAYAVAAVLLPGLLIASLWSLRRRESELAAADDGRGGRRRRDAGP